MRTPLLLLHGVVIRFLFVWWWRWMGLFPLAGLFVLGIRYYQRQQKSDVDFRVAAQEMLESYGVAGAWMVFLVGIWQLFHILWLLTWATGFRLLWIHMMVYLGALCLHKRDLAVGAHAWRWTSGVLIFFQSTQFGQWSLSMDIISMMISLSFALYACIVFVLWTMGIRIGRRLPALLFIFSQLTILVGVVYYADTLTLWTLLWWQIYLGVLYGVLQRVSQEKDASLAESPYDEDDLLYVILRGDRISNQQSRELTQSHTSLRDIILQAGSSVLKKLPRRSFTTLWALNLVFMTIQLWLILTGKTGDVGMWIDVWFWVSMIVYSMNYFVLQKQGITTWWQRVLTFFLINFGIYLTIYHIFGNVPIYLVGCGIVWSLCNAWLMIHLRSSSLQTLLTEKDYQYRLFGNLCAIVANSYFIFLLPMSLQLRFTLVMIYLALQIILLKYQLSSENKRMF